MSDIPGIIELPGSFSGSDNSPNPHLGPDAKNLRSLAIFIIEQAITLRAPDTYDMIKRVSILSFTI